VIRRRIRNRTVIFGRRKVIGKKLVLIGVIALLAGLVVAGCGAKEKASGQPVANAPAQTAPEEPQPTSAAAPVAVDIVAYYPFNESHQFIADYLKQVEKLNPGNVRVTLYDMQTPEGRKKWSTSGLSCAGVFVNGSTRQEIDRGGGKTETVDFLQRMDVFWAKDDFETVLKQILAKDGKTFNAPPREPEKKAEGEKAEGEQSGGQAGAGGEAKTAETTTPSSN
jgi:ABC-type glycerol-3-phosphate transport system substrate-binding protein